MHLITKFGYGSCTPNSSDRGAGETLNLITTGAVCYLGYPWDILGGISLPVFCRSISDY